VEQLRSRGVEGGVEERGDESTRPREIEESNMKLEIVAVFVTNVIGSLKRINGSTVLLSCSGRAVAS
jgi:hypothetical protein